MLRKYGLHVATFAALEAILVKCDGSINGKARATVAFISAAIAELVIIAMAGYITVRARIYRDPYCLTCTGNIPMRMIWRRGRD